MIADEVANRDTYRDSSSMLKKYVTDPRITVDVKNVPQYEIENRMSWWFTSNSDTPVRVEGRGDRRYTALSALGPRSPEYEAMLNGMHDTDGSFTADFQWEMGASAHPLQVHQVDWGLAKKPLDNAARDALIESTRSSAESFWSEVADRGIRSVVAEHYPAAATGEWDFRDDGVAVDPVYQAYNWFCEAVGMRHCRRESLGSAMRLFFPDAERRRGPGANGKRPYLYVGLPREARTA